ncbi:MAG: LysR family transcriptional regulator [Pseudomonadota bacterium]
MTMTDRLDLLQTFVRVAEEGALSRAAAVEGISQPSVSRRIKALETLTGARLIHRTTHHQELTDEGRRLLAVAREILGDWDAAMDELGDQEPRGLLHVAAPVGLGQTLLADEAATFLAKYPAVTIKWTLTDEPVDLIAGAADIRISVGAPKDDRLVVRKLMRVERVLVAAPSLAEAQSALSTLPLITLEPFYSGQLTLKDKKGRTQSISARVAMTSNNISAVLRAVLSGAGMALLPTWLVEPEITRGALTRVASHLSGEPFDITLAYDPTRGRPARLTKFVEHIAKSSWTD